MRKWESESTKVTNDSSVVMNLVKTSSQLIYNLVLSLLFKILILITINACGQCQVHFNKLIFTTTLKHSTSVSSLKFTEGETQDLRGHSEGSTSGSANQRTCYNRATKSS